MTGRAAIGLLFGLALAGPAWGATATGALSVTVSGGPDASIALTRDFNQLAGTTTPADAFWQIGQPFKVGEVPAGDVLSATLGGAPVRVQACAAPLTHKDGSARWMRLLVDYSGISIPGGTAQPLQLTAATGAWPSTTTRATADWATLGDAVTLANITGPAGAPASMTAKFDGGSDDTIATICAGPLGIEVEVKAALPDPRLVAVMDYWVTERADGSLGPIASLGPIVENLQPFLANPGEWTFDMTWTRGGAVMRSQGQVPLPLFNSATLVRPDGQWDWTASDPRVWVSQDPALVRATRAIPPIATGYTYTGDGLHNPVEPISAVSTTGVFTMKDRIDYAVMALHNDPTAVTFSGATGGLSGITLGRVYWLCQTTTDGPTFEIFDTIQHATAFTPPCSTTGQVIPTGTYTGGLNVELAVAPMSPGLIDPEMNEFGGRYDISWLSEWGAQYLIANTQPYQNEARAVAWANWTTGEWALNSATGRVPSLIDQAETPAAMGTAKPNTVYSDATTCSSDITGSGNPTCPAGQLYIAPNRAHYPGAVAYVVWLLEGQPYLQDFLIQNGNRPIAAMLTGYLNGRNITIGGKTYYGALLTYYDPDNIRAAAWGWRDISIAAWAAPEGGPEQAYFRTILADNAAAWNAWVTYKGGNFAALGIMDDDQPSGTMEAPSALSFQLAYEEQAMPMAAVLDDEFVPSLDGLATQSEYLPEALYGGASSGLCPYFGDIYTLNWQLSDNGAAAPGSYIASWSELGQNEEMDWNYDATANTVTATATMQGYAAAPIMLAAGDKFRPNDSGDQDGDPTNATPAPLNDGTDYYIINPSLNASGENVFQLSATPNGTPIAFASSVNNAGGIAILTSVQPCPNTGTIHSNLGSPDSYNMERAAGLGIAAAWGDAAALPPYNEAIRRAGSFPSQCATGAMSCMQSGF